jgi:hypothetical protein
MVKKAARRADSARLQRTATIVISSLVFSSPVLPASNLADSFGVRQIQLLPLTISLGGIESKISFLSVIASDERHPKPTVDGVGSKYGVLEVFANHRSFPAFKRIVTLIVDPDLFLTNRAPAARSFCGPKIEPSNPHA